MQASLRSPLRYHLYSHQLEGVGHVGVLVDHMFTENNPEGAERVRGIYYPKGNKAEAIADYPRDTITTEMENLPANLRIHSIDSSQKREILDALAQRPEFHQNGVRALGVINSDLETKLRKSGDPKYKEYLRLGELYKQMSKK